MVEISDDGHQDGPPPRPSPPRRKRESIVIQGTATEASSFATPDRRRGALVVGGLVGAALAIAAVAGLAYWAGAGRVGALDSGRSAFALGAGE